MGEWGVGNIGLCDFAAGVEEGHRGMHVHYL